MDNLAPAWPVGPGLPPVPIVVLAHTLPSGSVHWDVLIARDASGKQPLWSLRCDRRPDCAAVGDRIAAVRTPDHDANWLHAKVRPVSKGRGLARRIAVGGLVVDTSGVAAIQWAGGGSCRWELACGAMVMLDRSRPSVPGDVLDHLRTTAGPR